MQHDANGSQRLNSGLAVSGRNDVILNDGKTMAMPAAPHWVYEGQSIRMGIARQHRKQPVVVHTMKPGKVDYRGEYGRSTQPNRFDIIDSTNLLTCANRRP